MRLIRNGRHLSDGLDVAVIPHWDNAEGSGHDTRFCFLGERRLNELESQMPEGTHILGIDEHTALVIDLDAESAAVHGRGTVTVRGNGSRRTVVAGEMVDLSDFRTTNGTPRRRRERPPAAPDARDSTKLAQRVLEL